ncbi:serine hydrolase domain-containing protein [Pseudactinotalea sp. Z1732]|uniref:serine hydrolase domain-containing protein n=1 Tax=Micrococcales TaxID=85006 RepID=UPI003C7D81A6
MTLLPTTARRLDLRAATLQTKGRIPSLVTGLVRDSHLVWSAARGTFPEHADPGELQFRIGSITKTFVAVVVLQLRDAGALRLTDTVDQYVPGTPFGDRTLTELLTHTGGLAAELPGSWWERSPGVDRQGLHEALAQGTVLDRQGRHVHYSNIAFAVLGEVIAAVTGRSWDEVLTAQVLGPLQMDSTTTSARSPFATGYAVHPYADVLLPETIQDTGAMAPAGQLWSTVGDLSRWAAFLAGDTADVLHTDTLDEMCEPTALASGSQWASARGLGVQVTRRAGRLLVGHGGSMPGFQAGVQVDREAGLGVVTLMNCTTPGDVEGLDDPFDIVEDCEPRLPQEWVARADVPADVLALTGSWFWGTSEGTVRVLDEGWIELQRVSGMTSTSRFRPTGTDTWVGLDGYHRGEALRVRRAADGEPQTLDVGTFVFTRRPYEPSEFIPGGLDGGGWPVT